jgi:hypothetical protein
MQAIRGLAMAISSARMTPFAVSTETENWTVPAGMPRRFSQYRTNSSSMWISAALSAFGTAMPVRPGWMAASRSSIIISTGLLIRTNTSAPPRAASGMASLTIGRARAFSPGGTESSRSSTMASAPRRYALSTKRGWFTGIINDERRTMSVLCMS